MSIVNYLRSALAVFDSIWRPALGPFPALTLPPCIYGRTIVAETRMSTRLKSNGHYSHLVIEGMMDKHWWSFSVKDNTYRLEVRLYGDILYIKEDTATITNTNINDFVINQLKDYISLGLTHHELLHLS